MQQVVILMGPPGAGKGTQGQLLSEKYSLYYFETSKILEEAFNTHSSEDFLKIGKKKYYFRDEKKLWQTGKLCSPPFVAYLVQKKITRLWRQGESILLSGSPRTLFEGEKITPLLIKLYRKENIKVILINVPAKETIFRNSHRRICELMRHPIIYNNETKNLKTCPIDGSRLLKREGLDDPEVIKVRIKEYKERTYPLVDYFRKMNLQVKRINGVGTVAEVFQRVQRALKN